jgi:hypothetical protein
MRDAVNMKNYKVEKRPVVGNAYEAELRASFDAAQWRPVQPQTSENTRYTQMATVALVQQEALVSYELSKSRGDRARGLELLDQLDAHFQSAA